MAPTKKPTTKKEVNLNPITSIVSFEQFKKHPVAAVAFLCIVGMSYLYMDAKNQAKDAMISCTTEVQKLRTDVERLTERVRVSDSISAAALSQIKVFQQLGKIPE